MSQYSGSYAPQTGEPEAEPSTTDVAREEAVGVGQHARAAGGQVAQATADQARQVAAETGRQARDLLGEAQGQAQAQASAQQKKAAQQMHSVAGELDQMAANGGQSGIATEFARQAASRMYGAASWLDQREPADLLEEVRNFARRRPGTFLVGAALAGLAAGRLTRGLTAGNKGQPDPGQSNAQPGTSTGLPAVTGADPTGAGVHAYRAVEPADPAAAAYPGDVAGSGYPPVTEVLDPPDPGYPAEEADPGYPMEEAGPAEPEYPSEPGTAGRYGRPLQP